MKNIYAIGCGIIVGKNFGENAVASVISRSFAEIKSVGKKLGAQPETLSGLSGLGDLFLTCSSKKSRNFALKNFNEKKIGYQYEKIFNQIHS